MVVSLIQEGAGVVPDASRLLADIDSVKYGVSISFVPDNSKENPLSRKEKGFLFEIWCSGLTPA